MNLNFGLIGTITYDFITSESGISSEGVGGVLYQAAALCGLGKKVTLYANLGEELLPDVEKIIKNWPTLRREGIIDVPGCGNQVQLFYPERGERVETLKSVVPPLNPDKIVENISELGMLLLVLNSGFDIELKDWQKLVEAASCPIWIDIHSLALAKELNTPRKYLPLPEWKEWAAGVCFLQANEKEVASMLGHPQRKPSETELHNFGDVALESGVKAVFITRGKDGILVVAPDESKKIPSADVDEVVDTTGCGDVFCAGTVLKLAEGKDPFESASFGLLLATKATRVKGIEETYILASDYRETDDSSRGI
ncbi:MAG: hypothetical protein JSV96_01210 [Candidatus Aminicenantes bacterium]|nr:MAG: hypothetical protein JSV96_01210 [Candidatus Aminicenantes bacterium]